MQIYDYGHPVFKAEATHRVNFSEVPSTRSPVTEAEEAAPASPLWLVVLGFFALVWGGNRLKHALAWKTLKSRVQSRRPFHSIPCSSCQFFSPNPYIQCAVHPDKAMSTEAIDCSDYCNRKESNELSES